MNNYKIWLRDKGTINSWRLYAIENQRSDVSPEMIKLKYENMSFGKPQDCYVEKID